MAAEFRAWVERHPDFELLAPVDLNLVCFRYNPGAGDLTEEDLEFLNKRLMDSLNRSRKMFLTHTKLSGRFTLRMSIGGTNTTEAHVAAAWDMIQEHSKRLL
jgi:aromatic-L-amino-acid decarboxylase